MAGQHQHHPCKDCPFKKDTLRGWLNGRIEEIVAVDSFVCHKTSMKAGYGNEGLKQCAGHMLLLEEKNIFWRTAKIMRVDLKLKGREKVFDTVEDCINHHKGLG